MLNKNGQRELAYIVQVDNIVGMDADNLECVQVRGWDIVCGKKEFDVGDLAVFFEIDSQLPAVPPFSDIEFLKLKDYKIKSQKIRGVISQGLLIPLSKFNLDPNKYQVGDFLTEKLGVTYIVPEDNVRKSNNSKYHSMSQRYPRLAKTKLWKFLYKREWGKKLLFIFFGKKKEGKYNFPSWVNKTDEDRVQNLMWENYSGTTGWVVTEKIDGTSTTFTIKKNLFGSPTYLVCSRNVAFKKPSSKCYYDNNVYLQMSEKYEVEKTLRKLLTLMEPDIEWITIQGETFGPTIQNNDYGLNEIEFRAFNLIDSKHGRWNSCVAKTYLENFAQEYKGYKTIQWVPIIQTEYTLPNTIKEMLEYCKGNSEINDKMREGVVIRDYMGHKSFKVVNNDYLLKYHI